MGCKYICDACGREETATLVRGLAVKPKAWLRRIDKNEKVLDVCSTECARSMNDRMGLNAAIIKERPE